jgi:hypothetical protein
MIVWQEENARTDCVDYANRTSWKSRTSRLRRDRPGVENMVEARAVAFSRERPGHPQRPPGHNVA